MIHLTLFTFSFLAATFLPIGSEALLLYDLSLGYSPLSLIVAATAGNTLGSCVNYFIGSKGADFFGKKSEQPPKEPPLAMRLYSRYGGLTLLLSWAPFIGDPLTFIAGALKYDFRKFVLIVLFAKTMRYVVVSQLYLFGVQAI